MGLLSGASETSCALLCSGAQLCQYGRRMPPPFSKLTITVISYDALLLANLLSDVTAASNEGWTPLHTVSINGHVEVVKLLLENGPDVTCVSK